MLHHLCPEQQNVKPLVKWKDLLSSQWKGPDPLLTGGQGCACIFLQDADLPIWIPDRLIRHVTVPQAPGSSTAATTKKRKGTPLPRGLGTRSPRSQGGEGPLAPLDVPTTVPLLQPCPLLSCPDRSSLSDLKTQQKKRGVV